MDIAGVWEAGSAGSRFARGHRSGGRLEGGGCGAIQELFPAGIAIGRLDDAGPIEARTAVSVGAPRLLNEVCAANSCPCQACSVFLSVPLHGEQLKSRDSVTASLPIDESVLLCCGFSQSLLKRPCQAGVGRGSRTSGIRGLLAAPRNSGMPEPEPGTGPDAKGRHWAVDVRLFDTETTNSATEDGRLLTGSNGRTVVPPNRFETLLLH